MDRITISFPQLLPNGLQHADDIADGTILIPDSHIYNTPIIWNAVKSRMYFHAAFSKFLADVPGKSHISPSAVRIFNYYGIKFILFHCFRST